MNTIKKYISLFAVACLLFSSCDSFLETTPASQVNEDEFYKTDADFLMAITSVYHKCQDRIVQSMQYTLPLSDEAHAGGGGPSDFGDLQRLEIYNIDPSANGGWWSGCYEGIYRSNKILEKLDEPNSTSEAVARQIRGEAYFMRALFYTHLYTMYGGVVVMDHSLTPSEYYEQERATDAETYQFILADVAKAVEYLPIEVPDDQKGRVTRDAAYMVKARAVLQANDESRMDEIADDMIAMIESGRYELYPDFRGLWLREAEFSKEMIWEIVNTSKVAWGDWGNQMGGEGHSTVRQQGARGLYDPRSTDDGVVLEEGWGSCNPTVWLAEQFDKVNDTRYEGTLVDYEKLKVEIPGFRVADASGWYMYSGYGGWKYHPKKGYSSDTGVRELNYEMNHRQFRYAEALMIAAEAIARGSKHDISKAQNYLDQIRKRAFKDNFVQRVITKANWKEVIIEERNLEFALEGFRYWDLMRLDLGDKYLTALGWKPFHKYMPIPQSTIDNTKGKVVQNPGY